MIFASTWRNHRNSYIPSSGVRSGRLSKSKKKGSRVASRYLHGSRGSVYPDYSDSQQARRESRYVHLSDWRRLLSLSFADAERERQYEMWIWAKHRDRWAVTIWALFAWTLVLFALFFVMGLTGEVGQCYEIDAWGYCTDEQKLAFK